MSGARQRLMSELQALQKEKWADDLFRWRIGLMVINPESQFYGGYFNAEMRFSKDYPYKPPVFRFLTQVFHPNVFPDGQLCISILHSPGSDAMSGEQASERWSPLQGAESVLLSVLLLLDDPEINSAANVDASVMYRDNRQLYNARAKETTEQSKQNIPPGFVMPTTFEEAPPPKVDNDDAFWADSEEELDIGSDMDDEDEDDDDDDDEEGEEDEDKKQECYEKSVDLPVAAAK